MTLAKLFELWGGIKTGLKTIVRNPTGQDWPSASGPAARADVGKSPALASALSRVPPVKQAEAESQNSSHFQNSSEGFGSGLYSRELGLGQAVLGYVSLEFSLTRRELHAQLVHVQTRLASLREHPL